MTWYIARRGTQVVLVEAVSPAFAGPLAAKALRLRRCKPRRQWRREWLVCDHCGLGSLQNTQLIGPDHPGWRTPWRNDGWPIDWRGASLRPATEEEIRRFLAADAQRRRLSGLRWRQLREAMVAAGDGHLLDVEARA